ncbi:MAG: serine/threonine protein kinase [Kineosporiaceae bacterium]|nr:serine/threonine protein kinase [Kineosporiaceae bacterium]
MGVVYRASEHGSDRRFAAKVLRPEFATNGDVVTRFVRERQAARAVMHPNVVRVHEFVVEGDTLAIVMDEVAGGDLRGVLHRGRPAPALALALAADIAAGLTAIHGAGIVHRDLKPANILCRTGSGRIDPLITDFGVAGLLTTQMTTSHTVTGTYGYLAPEVLNGARATPPADLYALGVMVYEMLCGRAPFEAEHPVALALAHAQGTISRPPEIPLEVWAVLAPLVDRDAAARPTAAEAERGLRRMSSGEAPSVTDAADLPTIIRARESVRGSHPPDGLQSVSPTSPGGIGLTVSSMPGPAGLPTVIRRRDDPSRPFDLPVARVARESRGRKRLTAITAAAIALVSVLGGAAAFALLRGTRTAPGESTGGVLVAADGASPGGVVLPAGAGSTVSITGASPSAGTTPDKASGPASGPLAAEGPGEGRSVPSVPSDSSPAKPSVVDNPRVSALPPPVPVLNIYMPSPAAMLSSDSQAPLRADNVSAGSGSVASVTVRHGSDAIAMRDVSNYHYAMVTGLVNGTNYTFVARVCNTNKRCTDSNPVNFVPYDSPEIGKVTATVVGSQVKFGWTAVVMNSYPRAITCSLSVESAPKDASAPSRSDIDTGNGSTFFVGKVGTTYSAVKFCTDGRWSTGTTSPTVSLTG